LRLTADALAELFGAARGYHARGLSVFPVRGKIPAISTWKPLQEQPPTGGELQKWFGRPGITGVAVVLVPVSGGTFARDYDDAIAYHKWADARPDLARTLPTVRTSRGYHVYGRGTVSRIHRFEDGELRGAGYCLLPPSVHPSGTVYSWTVPLPAGELPLIDPGQAGLSPPSIQETQATQPSHCLCPRISTEIENAIARTLPTGPGQRNGKIFELARALKSLVPDADRADLREIIQHWHRLATPAIRTKGFTTTWSDFTNAWANIRVPKGAVLSAIITRAASSPPPRAAVAYDLPAMRQLIAICAALQSYHGPGRAWPLSCRVAGEAVEVGHDTAARWLKLLVADGVLELVRRAGPKGSRLASEYRYASPLGCANESPNDQST
jgi:hypothetical protein